MAQTRTVTPFVAATQGLDHRILRDVGLDAEGNLVDEHDPRVQVVTHADQGLALHADELARDKPLSKNRSRCRQSHRPWNNSSETSA